MIELSVVIISYNTKKLLQNCLLSLYDSLNFESLKGKSEVIVVDNDSKDGSVEIVKKEFPKVQIIKNSKNIGFGAANNQGIRIAKGKFILLLNSDTKLFPKTIETALNKIKKGQNIGALGVKLLNPDKTIQQSVGFFPNIFRVFNWMFFIDDIPIINKLIKPYHVKSLSFYNKQQAVDWITGAFFLARKEAILEAGLFDEKMFMYVEEVDLCYRIKKRSWQIIYLSDAFLIHKKGGSGKGNISGIVEELRGIEYFYQKHYSLSSTFLVKLLLKGGALLRVLFFAIIKHGEGKRKLYLHYLKEAR